MSSTLETYPAKQSSSREAGTVTGLQSATKVYQDTHNPFTRALLALTWKDLNSESIADLVVDDNGDLVITDTGFLVEQT